MTSDCRYGMMEWSPFHVRRLEMSKMTDRLQPLGIFNDYGFCYESGVVNDIYRVNRPEPPKIDGLPDVVPMISYSPAQTGRGYKSACWHVIRKHFATDPDAHWRDYGKKTFPVRGREEKKPQLEAAMEWASAKYGVREWAKTPFGAYAPAEFVKARLAQLLALTESPEVATMRER